MIGISGRCPTEPSSSSGLYPSPSNARARRGCTSVSERKTGCQFRRAQDPRRLVSLCDGRI